MIEQRKSIHGEWSSRLAFILAATGSAVGLGNIWRFPYVTGENGGGAFVLVYLLCIGLIGLPIMIAEVMLGRRGRQSPINTMRSLAEEEGRSSLWQFLGWAGVVSGFLILSFYSVIAGEAMAYIVRAASGMFNGITAQQATEILAALETDPERLLAWHTLFMSMTMVVVARGVQSGLEQAVRFLMPALFLMLLVLLGYAMSTGAFAEAMGFLFRPDFSKLTWGAVLIAMGQAFFSLSLGMGAIMVYGSYLPKHDSIIKTTTTIAAADTLVALLAGMVIFPIVISNGLQVSEGPGLVFKTLPLAFGQMWGGAFFGAVFFLLLSFAALTSAISLIEPAVAWMVENRGMSRTKAAVWAGVITWVLGLGTVLSFNLWSENKLFGMTFFDLLGFLTFNILLPLGGLCIAIFAAWFMRKSSSVDELAIGEGWVYQVWHILVRYVAPTAVIIVFLNATGVLPKITQALGGAAS